ncbi:DapH/DapD/GlmU-related protein [Microbacterium aurum]
MTLNQDIHSTAFIGDGVTLGQDVKVAPGAVLLGPLEVGDRVRIGPNAVIGTPPEISTLSQNTAWTGDLAHHGVRIGDDSVIRESVTIQQGSHRTTTIGSRSWLLSGSYVAHDVLVHDDVTLSAGARLGGHAIVGRYANIGMNAAIHQRRLVGPAAMVGMSTPVTRDIPPFAKVFGSPARMHGLNEHVLRKLGVEEGTISALAAAYAAGDFDLSPHAADSRLSEFARWWADQTVGMLVLGVDL